MLIRASQLSSPARKSIFFLPEHHLYRCFSDSRIEDSISPPTPEKLVSYLENCLDIKPLKKLHACIITSGLETHILLGSKLLNSYANLGKLADSQRVFDKIINRTTSLWNSALVGYFRAGQFDEVLRLYSKAKRENIIVDCIALTFSLKSCLEIGVVEFGREVHGDAFKLGLNTDRYVGSSLLGLYSKSGCVEDARKVFDEISEKDVIAYTAMVTGYAQLADFRAFEAFRIVGCMQQNGLDPNRVTLVSLLQAAAKLEELKGGRSVHGYAIRRGIDCGNDVFVTSLLDMYIKCGVLDVAASLFSISGTVSVACWNALIAGYVQCGHSIEALDLFSQMVRENIMPDLITLANGLLGCAASKCLLAGKSIHGYIISSGVCMDVVANTVLIDMYSKCGSVKQARELFDAIDSRDVVLFNVMIAGYVGSKLPGKAIETFYEMVKEGIRPNIATILSILSASAHMSDLRQGRWIHGYIVRQGLESNTEIANQTLYMYENCGRIDIAEEVFKRMTCRDLVSWTSMMMALVHHGYAGETIELFRLMQERMKPDVVTLISLLQAFSQLGCLKLALEVQCHMYKFQLDNEISVINSLATTYAKCGRLDLAEVLLVHTTRWSLTTWNTLIAAYGMHGKCVEALEVFNRMLEENIEPDAVTFTSLLSACSHAGMVEEGRRVFQTMIHKHSIVPCEEHYGCMVDLLARAGRIEEAYDLVKCLSPRKAVNALSALLAACRVHRNMEMGEIVAEQLLALQPENSGAYTLLSNIYAEAGNWDEVDRLRASMKEEGMRKQPGYSFME